MTTFRICRNRVLCLTLLDLNFSFATVSTSSARSRKAFFSGYDKKLDCMLACVDALFINSWTKSAFLVHPILVSLGWYFHIERSGTLVGKFE